ncbi:MAG: hypothetical protein WC107_02410 [Patescibacteria group bacterium]
MKGRLVLKFGTDSLIGASGDLCQSNFDDIARQISALISQGWEVLVVSSGAGKAGRSQILRMRRTIETVSDRSQTTVGQYILMTMWQTGFDLFGHLAGQILVSHADLQARKEGNSIDELSARLEMASSEGIIPIINENDAISSFGIDEANRKRENDVLTSDICGIYKPNKVMIITSVGGVFETDPRRDPSARMYRELDSANLPEAVLLSQNKSPNGSGGIASKAEIAAEMHMNGIATCIAHFRSNGILRFAHGESLGTLLGSQSRLVE